MAPASTSGRHTPSAEVKRRLYSLMTLMKATDERMVRGIASGEFIAIYYPHRGQEAIAAALGAVLREDDQLVTTYRNVHDHIGKGVPIVDILGPILGKATAPDEGKGGTMHVASPDHGAMLSTGIVGAGLPVAVGLGLATQLQGLDRVTAVCFGDGATNTGSFHEAANLAAVWNVPVVFVCQNNRYGEMTPIEMTMKIEKISERAASYGFPGVTVDGNDPDELYAVLSEATERARDGGGPTLVECLTFRFSGHSFGDNMRYIPTEQMEQAKSRDPLPAYRERLRSANVCSEEELASFDEAAIKAVEDAVREASAAPPPSPGALADHVYKEASPFPVLVP